MHIVFYYVWYRYLTDIKLHLKYNLLYTDKDIQVKTYFVVQFLYNSQFNNLII